MIVTVFSTKDTAGSGMKFAQALISEGHDAMAFVRDGHIYGYANHGDFTHPDIPDRILKSDVIHIKGDEFFNDANYGVVFDLVKKSNKPIVITVCGSGFRRMEKMFRAHIKIALQWHPIEDYIAECDVLTSITPDLCYEGYDIKWTPHACKEYDLPEKRSGVRHIRVGHSPSVRSKKGTNDVFLPAMKLLRAMRIGAHPHLIEKLSHSEAMKKKAECDVFFDQGIVPFYGMSAVEAMAMGKPVISRITKAVMSRDERLADCPVLALERPCPHCAADLIAEAIENKDALSIKTLEYFRRTHSYKAVSECLESVYKQAIKNKQSK
jgi:hypothetical protein